jgi:Protein of unknown function (DUF1559)
MKRRGLSFLELLLVIGMVGILIGLLVIAIPKARINDSYIDTQNGLRCLALASQNCCQVYKKLPPATGWFGPMEAPDETSIGGVSMTVHVYLLPFLEQDAMYKGILSGDVPDRALEAGSRWVVPALIDSWDRTLPAKSFAGITNYAANLRVFSDLGFNTKWNAEIAPGVGGVHPVTRTPWYYGAATFPGSIPDGTSNTIAFTTQYAVCGADRGIHLFFNSAGLETDSPFFGYYAPVRPASSDVNSNGGAGNGVRGEIFQVLPTQRDCNPSYTPQAKAVGLPVCMFDSSFRWISPSISIRTWGLLVQPNDGVPLPQDWDR